MKRVYREVTTRAVPGGWGVVLDGRPMRTPAKNELIVPTEVLAATIAAEWDAQQDEIRPATMPLTRLAATAIDRTTNQREQIIVETANYAGTDLVCYRADHPPELIVRQQVAGAVAAQDDFHLTALDTLTATCGSLVIALALFEGRLDAEAAFAVSQLDETFQIEAWGEDAEAAARRRALADDIAAAACFVALLENH